MPDLPAAARWLPPGTFQDAVAVVTGGGTGLGLEISRGLAALGAIVVIASRRAEHHTALLDESARAGWRVGSLVLDVREPDRVRSAADALFARHGKIDLLVNNAAGNFVCPAERMSANAWRSVVAIALDGTFYCSQSFGRRMIEQRRGSILNIVATYATTGMAGVAHSASAKAGVLALTKSLAAEWAPDARDRRVDPQGHPASSIRHGGGGGGARPLPPLARVLVRDRRVLRRRRRSDARPRDVGARMSTPATPRTGLPTEQVNPASADLDRLSVGDAFDVVNAQDAGVAAAVAEAKPEIVRAIEVVSQRLADGGRIFLVGAGTSGRLAVLDAAECPPTFRTEPWQVQGVIAGGARALVSPVEGAEDDRAAGGREMEERGVGAQDAVFGIAAGGTTPYVHGALASARAVGAATIFLACVPRELVPDEADVSIRVLTGPEVIAGSTRMKAGTATKMVLNLVSTLAMVRLGKVHGNLMIDVDTRGNAKLRERGIALVARLVACDATRAQALLDAADGEVKVAVAMGRLAIDATAARARLAAAGGVLRRVVD